MMYVQVNEVPPVFIIDNFLSTEECLSLIESGRSGLKRSIVVDGQVSAYSCCLGEVFVRKGGKDT